MNRLIPIPILVFGAATSVCWGAPFSDASIKFERNDTDGDTGLQLFLDGPAWESVQVFDPNGEQIFDVQGLSNLGDLGLTELFFETEEPSDDELPLAELLALFPEGKYDLVGTTVEGSMLASKVTLTHDIPDGPVITLPVGSCAEDQPIPVVIAWNEVTTPAGIDIVGYQVIVERETSNAVSVFSVDLRDDATSVTVPMEFLEPGKEYKFEVLAIEKSGNQTISEDCFETAK